MIKNFVAVVVAILMYGCGGGGGGDDVTVTEVNLNKSQNSLGYYGDLVLYGDMTITGTWAQYEYDSNGVAKSTVAFKHTFDNAGTRSLQVPLLGDTAYPIGDYGVDVYGTKILYNETNNAIGYYLYVSKESTNCIKIAQYKDYAFQSYYKLCKE